MKQRKECDWEPFSGLPRSKQKSRAGKPARRQKLGNRQNKLTQAAAGRGAKWARARCGKDAQLVNLPMHVPDAWGEARAISAWPPPSIHRFAPAPSQGRDVPASAVPTVWFPPSTPGCHRAFRSPTPPCPAVTCRSAEQPRGNISRHMDLPFVYQLLDKGGTDEGTDHRLAAVRPAEHDWLWLCRQVLEERGGVAGLKLGGKLVTAEWEPLRTQRRPKADRLQQWHSCEMT